MKLFLALVLMTSFAHARVSKATTKAKASKTFRTTAANTTKFDVRVPVRNWLKKMNDGFRVGIAQGSLATNLRYRSSNTAFDNSETDDAATKLQLHVGYEKIRTKEMGYSAFATYQNLGINTDSLNEEVRNMRLAGNATYGIDSQLYVYGGLNWGKYYGSEEIESNINSGIGIQAGLGAKIIKKLNVELEYLILQNEGRINNINVNVETKGILLKLNTPFTLNI